MAEACYIINMTNDSVFHTPIKTFDGDPGVISDTSSKRVEWGDVYSPATF